MLAPRRSPLCKLAEPVLLSSAHHNDLERLASARIELPLVIATQCQSPNPKPLLHSIRNLSRSSTSPRLSLPEKQSTTFSTLRPTLPSNLEHALLNNTYSEEKARIQHSMRPLFISNMPSSNPRNSFIHLNTSSL
jgi:hypothetical protein